MTISCHYVIFAFRSPRFQVDSDLGPVSRKPRKLIGPAQPVFVICILKTEKHIGPKLCMKGTSVHIKNIMELNSSVIIRLEILLWLSGCENFPGPSRNGPQVTFMLNVTGR